MISKSWFVDTYYANRKETIKQMISFLWRLLRQSERQSSRGRLRDSNSSRKKKNYKRRIPCHLPWFAKTAAIVVAGTVVGMDLLLVLLLQTLVKYFHTIPLFIIVILLLQTRTTIPTTPWVRGFLFDLILLWSHTNYFVCHFMVIIGGDSSPGVYQRIYPWITIHTFRVLFCTIKYSCLVSRRMERGAHGRRITDSSM